LSQEINRQGLVEVLRRTFGMVGARAPATLLTPEIAPSVVLELDRPEWSILAGEFRIGGKNSYTAVGDTSQAFLLNPTNSNAQVVIEHLQVSAPANTSGICANVGILFATPSTSGGSFSFPWDTRAAGASATPAVSPVLMRNDTAGLAVPAYDLWHADAPAAAVIRNVECMPFKYPVILKPGTHLVMTIETDNDMDIEWCFAGRARAFIPSELRVG